MGNILNAFTFKVIRGRSAIESSEVGVLLAVVVVVTIGAFRLLGGNITEVVTNVAGSI